MKQFDIPSVSPELANDNFFSNQFFLEYDFVVRDVLRDNYPWIHYTFKKMSGEVRIEKNATFEKLDNGKIKLQFTITNIGLQQRTVPVTEFTAFEHPEAKMVMDNQNATLMPRETRTISFEIENNASVVYNVRKEIALHFIFTRFSSDV